jgi:hypothetical protein
MVVLVSVTAIVLPLRLNDLLHAMGPSCPYDGLAAALKERGFRSGTIIATNRHDAGNLRRLFPDARIVSLRRPSYAPPIAADDRPSQVAVLWNPELEGTSLPKDAKQEIAKLPGSSHAQPEQVRISRRSFPSTGAPRYWEWMVLVIDQPPLPPG